MSRVPTVHFSFPQLRNLVAACINPNPEKRPDVSYVHEVAQKCYEQYLSQRAPGSAVSTATFMSCSAEEAEQASDGIKNLTIGKTIGKK